MVYYLTKKNDSDYLIHHGIKGQKWGVRRYQNEDGSLTNAGKNRYSGIPSSAIAAQKEAANKKAQYAKQRYAGQIPSSAIAAQKEAANKKAQYTKQRYAGQVPSSAIAARKEASDNKKLREDAMRSLGAVLKSAKSDRSTGYRSDGTYGFTEEYLEILGNALSELKNIGGLAKDGYVDAASISSEIDSFIEKVDSMKSVTGQDYEDVLKEAEEAYEKKRQKEFEARQKEYEKKMKANIPSSAWQNRIGKSTGVTKDVYKGRIWADGIMNKMRNSSELGERVQSLYNDMFGNWDEYLKNYK